MNIEEILEDMDDTLDRASAFPFASHKVIVDADRLRELINDIRLNIPAEIKRAKLIDFDCDRIIGEAKAKAEQIIQDAEIRAKEMCSQEAIQVAARQRGVDMLARAQVASNEIRAGTADYVNHLLSDAEETLTASLRDVHNARVRIEEIKRKNQK
ncbi:MAG: vacuolar-type H+-ATPase subunit H [Oscillospiraceae bacterium]|nr:vacuolar-type H+-ATPase subunit H [Oscillospiraceae bacterium]